MGLPATATLSPTFSSNEKNLKAKSELYGPYKILQKIGTVAYRLELPPGFKIHPIFHVSQLKKKIGQHITRQTILPQITIKGVVQALPAATIDPRLVKRHGRAEVKILVQWHGTDKEDATWMNYHQRFRRGFLDSTSRTRLF